MNAVAVERTEKNRELRRKFFHFAGLFYILGYRFLPRITVFWIMGILLIFVCLLDFSRLYYPYLNRFLFKLFGGLYRPEEEMRPSGLPFTFLGAFLTMFLFPQEKIVLCALGYQVFGDGLATLVGLGFGKIKILKKSLEGSIACFIVCLLIGLIFFDFKIALSAAFFATIIEMLPIPLPFNDNLAMPLLSALFLKILTQ
jgi:dolichol kinase